jgi:hypothetical protein
MARENYRIKTACPQCGCTELTVLSAREIKEKYGDLPNFDMECGECMEKYSANCRNNKLSFEDEVDGRNLMPV